MQSIKPFIIDCYNRTKATVLVPFQMPSRILAVFENRKKKEDLEVIRFYLCKERDELRAILAVTEKQYQKKINTLKKREEAFHRLAAENKYLSGVNGHLVRENEGLKPFSFQTIDSWSELKDRWLASVLRRINLSHRFDTDTYTRADERNRQAALGRFLSLNAGLFSDEELCEFKREAGYVDCTDEKESLATTVDESIAVSAEVSHSENAEQDDSVLPELERQAGLRWRPHTYEASSVVSSEVKWPVKAVFPTH